MLVPGKPESVSDCSLFLTPNPERDTGPGTAGTRNNTCPAASFPPANGDKTPPCCNAVSFAPAVLGTRFNPDLRPLAIPAREDPASLAPRGSERQERNAAAPWRATDRKVARFNFDVNRVRIRKLLSLVSGGARVPISGIYSVNSGDIGVVTRFEIARGKNA